MSAAHTRRHRARHHRTRRRRRRTSAAAVAALLLLSGAGLGWDGSYSAFARTAGNPGNGWRTGVVSLTHGWGGAPDDSESPREIGTNINPLISDNRYVEVVNAMPRMTAIPVNIQKV